MHRLTRPLRVLKKEAEMPTEEEIKAEAAAQKAKEGDAGAAGQKDGKKGEEGSKNVPVSALLEERNKRQSLEAKLKQMEAVFGDQLAYDAAGNVIHRQNVQPAQPAQQNNWADFHRQLDQMWESDPRKAMQVELTTALQWYDRVNSDIEDQLDGLRDKVKDIDQFRPQIRQYLRRLPIDQRAKQGIVEAAYYLQKGQSVDALIEKERQSALDRYQAGENVQGISG